MAPPKHILERRGLTEEEWAKGIRSKAQKEAIEKGGVAPAPAPAQAAAPAQAEAPAKSTPAVARRAPGAGL